MNAINVTLDLYSALICLILFIPLFAIKGKKSRLRLYFILMCLFDFGEQKAMNGLCEKNDFMQEEGIISTGTRRILFFVGCLILCMLLGQKIYAANSITVQKGEAFSLDVDINPSSQPVISITDSEGHTTSAIIGNGSTNTYYHEKNVFQYDKICFKVADDAEPGIYTIAVNDGSQYKIIATVVDELPAMITAQVADLDAKEPNSPVYTPKTAEEIYQEGLDEMFPSGHKSVSLQGDMEGMLIVADSGLSSQLWQAGTKLGEFNVKTADGTLKKLFLGNPVMKDNKLYIWVWINTNDGQEVTLDISEESETALKAAGISGVRVNNTYYEF